MKRCKYFGMESVTSGEVYHPACYYPEVWEESNLVKGLMIRRCQKLLDWNVQTGDKDCLETDCPNRVDV